MTKKGQLRKEKKKDMRGIVYNDKITKKINVKMGL